MRTRQPTNILHDREIKVREKDKVSFWSDGLTTGRMSIYMHLAAHCSCCGLIIVVSDVRVAAVVRLFASHRGSQGLSHARMVYRARSLAVLWLLILSG